MESKRTSADAAPQTPPKKHRRFKVAVLILLGIVALLLLAVLTAPTALSSAGGRRFLLSRINRAVDGQVGIDALSVGWFSGVKLTNLSFESSDGAAQVRVGRIESHPKYTSLIGGRVDMGKTVIDSPQIYLKLPAESDRKPAAKAPTTSAPSQGTPFVLPVHLIDLEVLKGDAVIEVLGANAQTRRIAFKNIASTVTLNDTGQTSRLNATMDVANGQSAGSVKVEAQVTPPKKGWTLEDTDGTFKVSISQLDLDTLAPLLALAGVDAQTGGVLNAEAQVQIRKGILETLAAEATIANFSQGIGDQKMVFDEPVTLSAKGGLKNNALQIDALNVKTPFCTVTGSGDAETLDYAVKADLAQTQTFLKQFTDLGGYAMAGQLDMSGRINIAEHTVASSGSGTIKSLLVGKEDAAAPPTDVSLNYDFTMDNAQQQLTIASAMLEALPGTIHLANASIPLGHTETPPISLTAKADLDLAKAWPYAQILAEAPADITLAGLLNTTLSVQTLDDTLHIKTDRTGIRNLHVAKEGSEPFVQDQVSLLADITLNPARQSIGINAFDMQSAAGETLIKIIKGTVEQSTDEQTNTMNAEIEAEYDLQAISGFAAPFLPEGLKVRGKRKDRLVLSSQWPQDAPEQKIANLNGTGGFGFERAEYAGLNVGPTELTMDIRQGVVNMAIPETPANQGKLRFAGTIDLNEEPMFLRLSEPTALLENVQINDIISSQLLTYVNPIFAGAVRTSGLANLTCRKLVLPLSSGHPDKLDIDGTVNIADVRLQAGDFLGQIMALINLRQTVQLQVRPTDFLVQQGRVSYRDMAIELGDYPLNFSGSLGLDNSLSMNVKLPLSMNFRPVRLADAGANRIEIPLGGTVQKPAIDTERLLQQQLEQQRDRLIQEGLRRLF